MDQGIDHDECSEELRVRQSRWDKARSKQTALKLIGWKREVSPKSMRLQVLDSGCFSSFFYAKCSLGVDLEQSGDKMSQ